MQAPSQAECLLRHSVAATPEPGAGGKGWPRGRAVQRLRGLGSRPAGRDSGSVIRQARPCPGHSAEAGVPAGLGIELATRESEGLKKRQRSASSHHSQPQPWRMRLLGKLRASAAGSAALEPVFSNVLTPDRIPKFCIPPRLPAPCTSESPTPAATLPRRCAAEPDLWHRGADDGAGRTDWDPRSQAALSLPHLPRARTAYGFCALLESPHTRRRESLFLGGPGAADLLTAPRPRARTYGGGGGGGGVVGGRNAPLPPPGGSPDASAEARGKPRPPRDELARRPSGRRFLRASEGLLRRALWARRSCSLARARSVSSGDEDDNEDDECRTDSEPPIPALTASPPPPPGPRPERLEAEGTVALGRAGGALRLAAEYSRAGGRLRVRLLPAEGPAGGAAELRAPVGCRVSFVLQPPGQTRRPRGAVVRRSRRTVLEQDLCLDGLTEDEVRRLAVRVKAENRGRLLGRGELLLGPLLPL
ncbi:C2 calcium-dependent domain-containing protein 4B [Camelus ferus]|uniref:C2 calcium-dependent domain-containing protein 4B n=1 Tax=Camelus ferus TaxID=419612 RepID=A0A8B8T4L1_CAMFR|nr:C2 calcium-dependent domain-containing protein 4B [Camelus ferus]